MIVQCPSCSTGYHWVPGPTANVRLRCSRCLVAFPCPTHRRSYALGPEQAAAVPERRASRTTAPMASILEPLEPQEPQAPARPRAMAPPPVPFEPAAPEPVASPAPVISPTPVREATTSWEVEPRARSLVAALLPLAFAAAGAAGAWLAAPVLGDPATPAGAWIASLPIPATLGSLQPWMFAGAGAFAGLLAGAVVWLGWRAARR